MCSLLRIPKSVSFPCLSPFRRPDLEFSPSTVKVFFCLLLLFERPDSP
jgi:hypothetical protein